jgi:hypothetical protein
MRGIPPVNKNKVPRTSTRTQARDAFVALYLGRVSSLCGLRGSDGFSVSLKVGFKSRGGGYFYSLSSPIATSVKPVCFAGILRDTGVAF